MNHGAKFMRPDSRGKQFAPVGTGLHYCLTAWCRGLVNKKKHHSPYCAKCRMARWKEAHPLKRSFHLLRSHAKERGKDFDLTFPQFETLCLNTEYMHLKGKQSMSLQIDRIRNEEGYSPSNVQVISLRENTLKEHRKQWVPFYSKQQENTNYEPTAEELENIERQLQ